MVIYGPHPNGSSGPATFGNEVFTRNWQYDLKYRENISLLGDNTQEIQHTLGHLVIENTQLQ